jgi:NAD(P)-dependent dehydrogenase (short-subunit alcohol dehydrogenase family)
MKLPFGKNYYLSKNGIHPAISGFRNIRQNYFSGTGSSLQGKIALVTGGYRGIGLAIVKAFLREGARVVFTGRNSARMKDAWKKLNTDSVAYMEWDISNTKTAGIMMQRAFTFFGKIDILVNNAGIYKIGGKRQNIFTTDEDFILIQRNNFIGTKAVCGYFIDSIGSEPGKIINIVSTTGFMVPMKPDWAYAISKWALLSYTESLGRQLAGKIMVNGIAPGPAKTEMSWKTGQSIVDTRMPVGRMGLPEEIAELACMLAGKSGDGICGQIFRCDGGFVLK